MNLGVDIARQWSCVRVSACQKLNVISYAAGDVRADGQAASISRQVPVGPQLLGLLKLKRLGFGVPYLGPGGAGAHGWPGRAGAHVRISATPGAAEPGLGSVTE